MDTQTVNLDAGQFEVDNSSQSPVTLQSGDFEVAGGTPGQAPVNPYAKQQASSAIDDLKNSPFAQAQYNVDHPNRPQQPQFPAHPYRKLESSNPATPGGMPVTETAQGQMLPEGSFEVAPHPAPTTYAEENAAVLNPGTQMGSQAQAPLSRPGVTGNLEEIPTASKFALSDEDLAAVQGFGRETPQMAAARAQTPVGIAAGPRKAVGDIGRGAEDVSKGLFPDTIAGPPKGQKPGTPDLSRAAKGGTEIMGGLSYLGTPLFAEAAVAAPVRTIGGYLAGIGAGKLAGEAAKAVGATPEEQEFANTLAFFLPTAAVTLAGLEVSKVAAGENGAAYRASAFGGRVKVAAGQTPEATGVGAQVGPYTATVIKPRGGNVEFSSGGPAGLPGASPTGMGEAPSSSPDPISLLAQDQGHSVVEAAGRAEETERVAHDIANGITPPTPPKPPDPSGMDQGHIQQSTVDRLGQIIQSMPPAMQPRAILESVKSLAKWLFDKKTVVGPDDKVVTVETPQQAQSAAVKMVNGEIDRQKQQAQAESEALQQAEKEKEADRQQAQEEREESLAPQGSESSASEKPQSPPVEIPDTPAVRKAREVLENLPLETTAEKADKELGRTVLLPTPIRKALVEEFVSSRAKAIEGAAQESMTGEPTPQGQKPEEIDAWIAAVQRGEAPFAHVWKGTTYQPTDVEGLAKTKVDSAKTPPGAAHNASGIYYHDPEISGAEIRKAARAGTLDQLTEKWKASHKPATETVDEGGSPSEPVAKQEATEEGPAPAAMKRTPYEGVEGKKTRIELADGSSIPAVNRMVELSSLTPSHNGVTFAPNTIYPPGVQERTYHKSRPEQMKVQNQEANFNPDFLVNTTPTATDGPPIVTSKDVTIDGVTYPAGTVLSANSRVMTLERLYTNGADAPYSAALAAHHRAFGFPPEVLEGFDKPVHVREIEPPTTLEEMHRLGSLMNKGLTQSLDAFDQAVSMGKHLSEDTLTGIAALIRSASDGDSTATLNSVLGHPQLGRRVIRMLEDDGVITERNQGNYVDPSSGLLTVAARNQLGNALLANLLNSRDLMEKTPAIVKQKLLGVIGSISAISSQDDQWNISAAMREAAREYGELARQTGMSPTEAVKQEGMFATRGPVVETLIKKYDQSIAELRKAMNLYTTGMDEGRNPSGMLVGLMETPEARLDFNYAFGTEITKEQWDEEMQGLAGGAETDKLSVTEPAEATPAAEPPAAPIQGRQADEELPGGVGEDGIRDILQEAERWATMPHIGLRMIADDYPEVKEGDILKPSWDWFFSIDLGQHGTVYPGKALDGTSAVEVERGNEDVLFWDRLEMPLELVRHYPGSRLALIESEEATKGRDPYEIVMKSPRVLTVIGEKPAGTASTPAKPVRLYHSSAEPGRYEGPAFFSTNRAYAENYRPGGELQYVDYPADKLRERLGYDEGNGPENGVNYSVELDSSETGPRKPVSAPSVKPEISEQEPQAPTAPKPFEKGDKVLYTTNKGKTREATIEWVGNGKARIKDGKWSFTKPLDVIRRPDEQVAPEASAPEATPAETEGGAVPAASKPEVSEEWTLVDHLYHAIQESRAPKDYNGLKKLVAEYDKAEPDQLRMKQAQESYEAANARNIDRIIGEGRSSEATFKKLVAMYENQPNLGIRTSTSIENQAYSTPGPLAYVTDLMAGMSPKKTVYEPTAGNGMLLLMTNPSKVHANELDPYRAANLQAEGFRVTQQDASSWSPAENFDVVVANPPFGGLKGPVQFDGYTIVKLDHLIALKALERMKDDGQAAIIIGAMGRDKVGEITAQARPFFNYLYSHYNIGADFEVAGDLYSRQGASWPVRVIAINGRARSTKVAPTGQTVGRFETWEGVYEAASQYLGSDLEGQRRANREPESSLRTGSTGESGGVSRPSSGSAGISDNGGSGQGAVSAGSIRDTRQPGPIEHTGGVPTPGVGSADSVVSTDGDVDRSDRLAEDQPRERVVRRGATEPREAAPVDLTAEESDDYQGSYTPFTEKKDVNVLAPKGMLAPMRNAMEVLAEQVGDLDQWVADELSYTDVPEMHKGLMGLQVDGIALGLANIQKGKALIIADQTGVGKARQAGAIIRWSELHGYVPIFVTAKPTLFSDIQDELQQIGSNNISPLLMNEDGEITNPVTGAKSFQNKGAMGPVYQRIIETGKLPEGRNALYMTYSQIATANRQRDVVRRLAPNAIMILDEAHTAAGGESNTGQFFQEILSSARGGMFLSATYAKRPDNLPLYAGLTDMGLAITDKEKISDAIARGGAPLQTVLSAQLAQAGQLVRRERSFKGITFETNVDERNQKDHERISNSVTEILRGIVKADAAYHNIDFPEIVKDAIKSGMSAGEGGNRASTTVNHMEFTSIVHNLTQQLLLALKADAVADAIIQDIRDGVKPLVALEKTMGSFLNEYTAARGVQVGELLTDLNYSSLLSRALDRTRYYNLTDQTGKKTRVQVPLDKLSPPVRALYDATQKLIDRLDVDIPVSPIDWIRNRVEQAGHTIAEITGRKLRIDYSGSSPKLDTIPALEQKDRVNTARQFNNGGLDAIILNQAGSTGISLHASERFQDQRARRMWVMQPAGDVNQFMQMLGRINRTGQVALPLYGMFSVALPAELRPAMTLAKKMKSLNANTTSNTKSATSIDAADVLNKYGDQVVAQYLMDNPGMAQALGLPLPTAGQGEVSTANEELARKATGRSALLPVKQQQEFLSAITEAYTDYINYLDATGQNDLEPKTYNFEAMEKSREIVHKGADPRSPFGADAFYGEYSIKRQGKPYKPEEVQEQITAGLDGARDGREYARKLIESLDQRYKEFYAGLETDHNKERARGVYQQGSALIREWTIGSAHRLEINGDIETGIVTNVEPSKRPSGNPFAPSAIKITFAINSPLREVRLPGSQLKKVQVMSLGDQKPGAIFKDIYGESRQTAKIITGNLLGAYGAMKTGTKGRIVTFTMKDGSLRQGILMPAKFDPAKEMDQSYAFRTPEAAEKWLYKATQNNPGAAKMPLTAGDDSVGITRGRGDANISIKAKPSKSTGGKFFLDPRLRELVEGGDFATQGGYMVGRVKIGSEREALKIIMQKVALYAPQDQANEARELEENSKNSGQYGEEEQGTRQGTGNTSTTFSMLGTYQMEQAGKAAYEYAQKAIPATWNELVKTAGKAGRTGKQIGYELTSLLYPSALADSEAKDIMGRGLGEPALEEYKASQLMDGIKKMFAGMSQEAQVAFIDREQHGEKQPTEDLQQAAALMRTIIEQQRLREEEAINLGREEADRIDLANKENYFPNRYKRAPGDETPLTEEQHIARLGRRPFAGNKAFLKQQTWTMKRAVEEGGAVPLGDPVDILMRRLQEGMKFVAAQHVMHNFKEAGDVQFLRKGKAMPAGFSEIPDPIAKVWRPVETAEGGTVFVQSGKWIGRTDNIRLLNNYLSTDWIRGTSIGQSFVKLKNVTTEMRLGFSLFHWGYITIENIASALNTGLDKAYNQGFRQKDPAAFFQGMTDAGKAIFAPFTAVREGGQMIQYARNPDEFLNSPEGQRFAQKYPDYPVLQKLLFRGGLRWGMAGTYRESFGDGFPQAMKEGQLGSGMAKAFPWMAHAIMQPLFEHYIPRSKWVFAVNMLAAKLNQYSYAIATDQITPDQIAREVVQTTDNRFGELNWDTLYLNNTMRTAVQLAFRSATWKLGAWRGLISAGQEQFTSKAFNDRIFEQIGEDGDAWDWLKDLPKRAPQMGMNAGWLMAMGMVTAIMGGIISRMASGRWPWQWARADHEKSGLPVGGAAALEAMYPRTGKMDEHGEPIRFSFPTGLKDYVHGVESPGRYIKGSMSDWAANAWDTLQNRDAFGNYVYNPNDPAVKAMWQGITYNLRGDLVPMSVQNYGRQYGPQDTASKVERATGMVGGAPKTLDRSKATTRALEVRPPHTPETPEEIEERKYAHEHPTIHQVIMAAREKNLSYLDRIVKHQLTYTQAKDIYENYASREERATLLPLLMAKQREAIKKAARGGSVQ